MLISKMPEAQVVMAVKVVLEALVVLAVLEVLVDAVQQAAKAKVELVVMAEMEAQVVTEVPVVR
jgi:hypothetical protein